MKKIESSLHFHTLILPAIFKILMKWYKHLKNLSKIQMKERQLLIRQYIGIWVKNKILWKFQVHALFKGNITEAVKNFLITKVKKTTVCIYSTVHCTIAKFAKKHSFTKLCMWNVFIATFHNLNVRFVLILNMYIAYRFIAVVDMTNYWF